MDTNPKKKLLLVDDSATILMVEKTILKGEPYTVITAGDGQDAVNKALAEHPDLILMDVVMPNKNGFEACRELRGNEATRDIPIILVTTRGEPFNVEAGFEAGCNDYVTKPLGKQELLEKIRNHVAVSRV
jgi:CheY-like chemotaxis protein